MSTLVELEAQTRGLEAGLKLADTLRADPAHRPGSTLLKGDALMRARRYNAAIRAFLDEYEADRNVPPLLRAVAAQAAAGQDAEAARLLNDWLRTAPNTPAVLQALAKLDLRANRLPDAQAHLEALLTMIPDEPVALNNLAWTYQQLGDKRARATAQRAYLQAPAPDTADTLGWILLGENDAAAAAPLLQQANDGRTPDPGARYHWAAALKVLGRAPEAVAVLEPLLARPDLFPDRPAAEALLKDLRPK